MKGKIQQEYFTKIVKGLSVKDLKNLDLVFFIPNLKNYYLSKLNNYYSNLFGGEGDGLMIYHLN